MTENSFIVLCVLDKLNAYSPVNAVKRNEIAKVANDFQVKSASTVYKQLIVLCSLGYVAEGVKNGKYNTYYLTKAGKQYLKEA